METRTLKHSYIPVHETVMQSGLTVITAESESPFVEIAVCFRVGSLLDTIPGTAHFLEHAIWEGPARSGVHPKLRHLVPKGLSGNADTSQFDTTYHAWILVEYAEAALQALFDICFDSEITERGINDERGPILQEARQKWRERAFQRWGVQTMYPDHKRFHHDPGGTLDSIPKITIQEIREFYRRYYVAANTAVIVAGGIKHAAVLTILDGLQGRLPQGKSAPWAGKIGSPCLTQAVYTDDPPTSFVVFYWAVESDHDPKRNACLKTALNLLVDNPFGLLYQSLRLEKGLAYSTEASLHAGYVSYVELWTKVHPDHFATAEAEMLNAIGKLCAGKITEEAWETAMVRRRIISFKNRLDARDSTHTKGLLRDWVEERELEDIDYDLLWSTVSREEVIETAQKYLRDAPYGRLEAIAKMDRE